MSDTPVSTLSLTQPPQVPQDASASQVMFSQVARDLLRRSPGYLALGAAHENQLIAWVENPLNQHEAEGLQRDILNTLGSCKLLTHSLPQKPSVTETIRLQIQFVRDGFPTQGHLHVLEQDAVFLVLVLSLTELPERAQFWLQHTSRQLVQSLSPYLTSSISNPVRST